MLIDGDSYGYSNGYGDGYSNGDGYGDGNGDGDGDSYGYGDGYGNGNGYGDGYSNSTDTNTYRFLASTDDFALICWFAADRVTPVTHNLFSERKQHEVRRA